MDVLELSQLSEKVECHFQITKDTYRLFTEISGDRNPLHVDEIFAVRKGFANCVMYGNILNLYVSYFVGMALPTPDVMIHAQDINYRKPLFLGDKIKLVSVVDSVSEAVNVIVYKLKFYRTGTVKDELVANGHVQVGLLKDLE